MFTFHQHSHRLVVCFLAGALLASAAAAQGQAPQAPATVSRANGEVVVRAIHLAEPLTVDGKLNESVYERDTTVAGYPALRNRAFVVKATRLFQF